MSVILQPQAGFPIVRQIGNHTDTTTYYVRAVVRNADGAIIDTVNLAAQGSQRYQSTWQVPADPTGRGIYVSIITSVYTDSGYTTKSENYSDEENTYLVFDRVLPAMRGGGGGGIDARTLRRIVSEELDKRKEEVTEAEPEEPARWGEVLANIGYIADELSKVPKEHMDMKPVLDAIKNKPVTEVSLDPVFESINSAIASIHEKLSEVRDEKKFEYEDAQKHMEEMHDSVSALVKDTIKEEFGNLELVTTQTVMHTKEAPAFDLNQYAK